VTLNNGGIAPGADSGTAGTTLHDFSLKWNGGGTMEFQLGDTSDQLALTGALTKGSLGAYTIDLVDAGITQSSYTLATFASTTFQPTNFTLELPAGYTGSLVETSTSLSVDLTFVGLAAMQPAALVTYGTAMTQSLDQATSDSASQLVVTPAPEPGSALLLAFGGSALLGWRRRQA